MAGRPLFSPTYLLYQSAQVAFLQSGSRRFDCIKYTYKIFDCICVHTYTVFGYFGCYGHNFKFSVSYFEIVNLLIGMVY